MSMSENFKLTHYRHFRVAGADSRHETSAGRSDSVSRLVLAGERVPRDLPRGKSSRGDRGRDTRLPRHPRIPEPTTSPLSAANRRRIEAQVLTDRR